MKETENEAVCLGIDDQTGNMSVQKKTTGRVDMLQVVKTAKLRKEPARDKDRWIS